MQASKRKVSSPQLSPNEQNALTTKKGSGPSNENNKSKASSPPKAGSTQLTLHGSKIANTTPTGMSRRTKQERLDDVRKQPKTPIAIESDNEFSTPPDKSTIANEDKELDRVIGEIQKATNERRKSTPNRNTSRVTSPGRARGRGRGQGRSGRGSKNSPTTTPSQPKIQGNTQTTLSVISEASTATTATATTSTEK